MHGCGSSYRLPSVFLSLHKLGVGLKDEDAKLILEDAFINRAIGFAANHVLRVTKHKARIPVEGTLVNAYRILPINSTSRIVYSCRSR